MTIITIAQAQFLKKSVFALYNIPQYYSKTYHVKLNNVWKMTNVRRNWISYDHCIFICPYF